VNRFFIKLFRTTN